MTQRVSSSNYDTVQRRTTPIKNKSDGERDIALSREVCDVLNDWLPHKRPNVTDKYGREPLVSTRNGRIGRSSITNNAYNWTRPCYRGTPCPLDRAPDECEAASYTDASKCPESVSSHAVRRGSITHHLTSDIPVEVVSARANVEKRVLDMHYDQRSERTKMEQRRRHLDNL